MMTFNHTCRKLGGSHWVAQVVLICAIAVAMVAAAAPRSGGQGNHDEQVLAAAGDGDLPALTQATQGRRLTQRMLRSRLHCPHVRRRIRAKRDRQNASGARRDDRRQIRPGPQRLSAAVARSQKDVVGQLLRAGADPDARLTGHHSAFEVASENGDAEMLTLLKSTGK